MPTLKNLARPRSIAPALLALMCGAVYGQSSTASYNGLHAIVGVKIVIGDGRVIEKGTVVIRDGQIVAVAADAATPRGADVLDGKGLTVYPGFIDAFTTKGFTAPPANNKPDPDLNVADFASAFMRETVRKGIAPEIRAVDSLGITDEVLKPYQSAGFTTVLVAPGGNDMSGVAALVNLSGRPTRECVVRDNIGQSIGFGASRWGGGYPSSLMGHIAQLRQTFLDAQWFRSVEKSFQAGGSKRPPVDPSLIALQPVISGKLPVVFDADSEGQVERALDICSEFGLKPIIAGATEGWRQLDAIKKSSAPVLLSLAFGKEPKDSAPNAKSTTPPAADVKPETPPATEPPPFPENPAKLAEQLRLYRETLKNPALIVGAGIPVAFSTKGTKTPAEFMENLRKAVAAGLTSDAALRALTIDAAKIFGVERQLGTIEAGKIANVIVMTGDFLDAKTKVKMLYIDGRKIDPAKTVPPATPKFRFDAEGAN